MGEWNKIFITPQKFHDDIIKLCNMIPKDKYNYVCGVPRGGVIIAIYVSHYCNITFSEYEEIDYIDSNETILIVDDLTDTGKTLKEFQNNEQFETAVLYYKPRSIIKPTYFVEHSDNDQWIVFPYEKPDEEPNREI